jgi:diketogulonate reductase-like aldo/keto reductase
MDDACVPSLLFGTAWKNDSTVRYTENALRAGLRGVDTANQRQHYNEPGVGTALTRAFEQARLARTDLFVQSKFTYARSHERAPYDAGSPVGVQVEQSFASSLQNLGVTALDSYLLHSPWRNVGVARQDWEAWQAFEGLVWAKKVRFVGLSNVSADQLETIHRLAEVKPAFVQNRCEASRGWDRRTREACAALGVTYQGFSLLTANSAARKQPVVLDAAARTGRSPEQVIIRFALQLGIVVLTGPTTERHLHDDVACFHFTLTEDEVRAIEALDTASGCTVT